MVVVPGASLAASGSGFNVTNSALALGGSGPGSVDVDDDLHDIGMGYGGFHARDEGNSTAAGEGDGKMGSSGLLSANAGFLAV